MKNKAKIMPYTKTTPLSSRPKQLTRAYQTNISQYVLLHYNTFSEQVQESEDKMSEFSINKTLVRMEGIKEAAELFGLPKHLVRTLALEGKIKAVRG